MATANVGRYVVFTEETYERDAWRSEFFVSIDEPDLASALLREGDSSVRFATSDAAADAAIQRGVDLAHCLPDPVVMGLLTLRS
jgi:hypothetical protein